MHVKVHWNAVDQSSLLYAYLADIYYDDGTGEMELDDVKHFVHELVDDVIASLEDPRSHRVRLQSLVHVLQTS
ncbi:hypothetical protein SPRG_15325 [Saprolegnia parasitica CBS 223.65]|uniref:Uncharacterized protein n=1 Tax=Saprolegnia parasitica (strain CBS 223.65) TaxID=695850 RepID=A0A067BRS8_SAPPC|nr:hypothetical protein SPRG_15325 [Saprolegnia parasitica CBS 223.65]KDO19510.1 hypothetical protein SPRG_15325 [Saprolegnia parasitica CBS 223.65]|eukprot:XP_012209774.1 hypothetical protein SPRG_15325 [Saprolegnia parasitica CBS 223.65]